MDMTGRGPANPLPKSVVQNFMYQLLIGIAHLHRHGVMHRFAGCTPFLAQPTELASAEI